MYTNTGYMNLAEDELEDTKIPLRVNSCGIYRLVSLSVMSTSRPLGRSDYQLLYVAAGKAFFTFDGTVTEVSEGSMVLYSPHTPQQYAYYLDDKPEVYWLHFTGSEAPSLTREAGFLGKPDYICWNIFQISGTVPVSNQGNPAYPPFL
ncbi:AraC family ligand binding domain-containing protein [Lacrimispora xylanisolvens]|uniref:AraC family ligand binding domain-containing protein n=1 Tax=Lacrimispora xylanisolvens TaxID=384636 RepID=UPI002402D623